MSLRYEQYDSLKQTRELLRELLHKSMPRKETKEKIRQCLRHYPPLTDTGRPVFSKDNLSGE